MWLPNQVWSIDYSPDGGALACACSDALVTCRRSRGGELAPFREHQGGVRSVRSMRAASAWSACPNRRGCALWDFASREQKARHFVAKYDRSRKARSVYACFAPTDGRSRSPATTACCAGGPETDVVDESKVSRDRDPRRRLSPDGAWLAVGTDDRIVYLLQLGGERRIVR